MTQDQVLAAVKAHKYHSLNLPHNEITGAEQVDEKRWKVRYKTTWGSVGCMVIRVEIEDNEIEIY